MKNILLGMMMLPAFIGIFLIYHVLIATKSDGHGGDITNRISRTELVWLAINKPHLFTDLLPDLTLNVEDRHRFEQKELVGSTAFDYEHFVTHNPDLATSMVQDKNLVAQYWLSHLHECRVSSPQFNVIRYQQKYVDIATAFNGDCVLATYHWSKNGISEGRTGM